MRGQGSPGAYKQIPCSASLKPSGRTWASTFGGNTWTDTLETLGFRPGECDLRPVIRALEVAQVWSAVRQTNHPGDLGTLWRPCDALPPGPDRSRPDEYRALPQFV